MMLKKLTKKNILLLILGALLVAIFIFTFTSKNWPAPNTSKTVPTIQQSISPPIIDVSAITYDAKTTIPNTGVTFAYPKLGYYGMGAKIETAQHFGTYFDGIEYYALISTAPTGQQEISVAVYNMGGAKTLDDIVSVYRSNMDDMQRRVAHRQLINGTLYFLQPPVRINNIYRTSTIINGHLLEVTFGGGFDVKSEDDVPIFVTQFLTKLDFTCSTDCSDNSAQVINMDKYRFGNTE